MKKKNVFKNYKIKMRISINFIVSEMCLIIDLVIKHTCLHKNWRCVLPFEFLVIV